MRISVSRRYTLFRCARHVKVFVSNAASAPFNPYIDYTKIISVLNQREGQSNVCGMDSAVEENDFCGDR